MRLGSPFSFSLVLFLQLVVENPNGSLTHSVYLVSLSRHQYANLLNISS